jgi:hypothetical protein
MEACSPPLPSPDPYRIGAATRVFAYCADEGPEHSS